MQLIDEWYKTEQVKFGASANAKSLNAAAERGNAYHRKVYKLLEMQLRIQNMDEWELMIEPWFRNRRTRRLRSPDAVLLNAGAKLALVVEVKLNWAGGKDEKLLDHYLPIVSAAFNVRAYPCMVVQCLRGYEHEPLKGLMAIWQALKWNAAKPTPVTLVL